MKTAADFLKEAASIFDQRATLRDTPEGERSMKKTVELFNKLYDMNLSEVQGWQFMVLLKMVRGSTGAFHLDDFIDQIGYSALATECVLKDE